MAAGINKKKAQLIFTSHDLSTMNSEVFRRDEIWFVAKGNVQNSKLYSLVEFKNEKGGLSGEPLREKSTETIREMYKLTQGKVPIIGVGGIASGKDAYEKIKAGASVVEVYSALVYQGMGLVPRIKKELVELLQKDGYKNISEAVGKDVKL